ncbi:MAG: efflux RND transporter periplasmic adaptor subunit [bacterium]|nr:efflux RND transporter periplasmic adaptor subunit [bacterium]
MKKKKKTWLWIIIVALVVAAAAFAVYKSKTKDTRVVVTVETAAQRRLVATVSASGTVEPVEEVKVSAEIPGRIVDLTVKEGQRVEKGQFLVQLDPETYNAALESAASALRSARSQKQKSEADLGRVRELVEKGGHSQADLDAAVATAEMSAAQLDQALAEEKRARENLAKTRINAPMSGWVSRLNKELGELTLGSQFQEDVILVIAELSQMQVRAEVDENDIVGVKLGDSAAVEIDAFPDTLFTGRVVEIAQSASQASLASETQARSYDVKVAVVDSIAGIRPGMSATVDIATDFRDDVLSVSLQCVAVRDKEHGKTVEIKEDEEKKSSREVAAQVRAGSADTSAFDRSAVQEGVFIFAADSAVWKPVKTGLSSDRHIEIIEGIADGDSVISGPYRVLARDLVQGMKIKLREEPKMAGKPQAR